jgi:flagellar biosynthesis GTPase FlhF
MNNKKKILVILIAIFLCSGMFFISEIVKYSSSSKTAQTNESEVKELSTEVDDTEKISDDNKETKKEITNDTEDVAKSDNENKQQDSDKSTENKTEATQQTTTTQEPQQQTQPQPKSSKVIVQNGIIGSTILSKSINASNKSVGEATTSALDSSGVDYKATGFGPAMYIASIAGLSEKAEGPTSGWIYYVQKGGTGSFTKPGVSCGSYKLQDGDVVLWKYVKEGA